MNFDFFSMLQAAFLAFLFGIVTCWAIMAHPVQMNEWAYYHARGIYSMINYVDPCPRDYTCRLDK